MSHPHLFLQINKCVLFLSIATIPPATCRRGGRTIRSRVAVYFAVGWLLLFWILQNRWQISSSAVGCGQEPLGMCLRLQERISSANGRGAKCSRGHQWGEGRFHREGWRRGWDAGGIGFVLLTGNNHWVIMRATHFIVVWRPSSPHSIASIACTTSPL